LLKTCRALGLQRIERTRCQSPHQQTKDRAIGLPPSRSMCYDVDLIGMTGAMSWPTPDGELVMPLNELPEFFSPETRRLVDAALEQAWHELDKDGVAEPGAARRQLARTIVALASVGETDPRKLKWFALHATRGGYRPTA
jgi:hypothetical protein